MSYYPRAEEMFPDSFDALTKRPVDELFRKVRCSVYFYNHTLDDWGGRQYEINALEYYYMKGKQEHVNYILDTITPKKSRALLLSLQEKYPESPMNSKSSSKPSSKKRK